MEIKVNQENDRKYLGDLLKPKKEEKDQDKSFSESTNETENIEFFTE